MQDGLMLVNGRPHFDAQGKVSGRELRRHLERLEDLQRMQAEGVAAAGPVLKGLLDNQAVIKAHVEALEAWRQRGFWGRLAWLMRGR